MREAGPASPTFLLDGRVCTALNSDGKIAKTCDQKSVER